MAAIGGYDALANEAETLINIWDGEDLLGSVPIGTTDDAILLWVQGYEAGRRRGELLGRYKLQYELRFLMDAAFGQRRD